MLSEFYEFGGTLFRIDSEEPLLESKYTAPFACTGTKTPDFVITVGYSGEKMQNGFSNANRSGSSVRTEFAESYRGKISAKNALEGSGIFRMLAEHGGVVLHSSYIITQRGEALLFSAPSGTGKSTQAELWRSTVGASIVNGDRTLITPTDAGADAAGIIWCGTSGICRDLTAPIRAIALISHGNENSARPATPIEAFSAILGQTTYDINDPCAVSAATDICARVISRVPVIRLSCLPDASAVHFYGKYLDEVAQKWKTT